MKRNTTRIRHLGRIVWVLMALSHAPALVSSLGSLTSDVDFGRLGGCIALSLAMAFFALKILDVRWLRFRMNRRAWVATVLAVALVHIGLVSPENGPAFPAEYAQVVAIALLASCVVPVRRRHGRGAYRPGSQLNGSALLPRSSDTVWFDLFRPHCWLLGARLCSLRGPPL